MHIDKWESFLFFGGEMPDLYEDNPEVPMPRGFYVCRTCGKVTNYWEPGWVCEKCEYEGEMQMEDERGN